MPPTYWLICIDVFWGCSYVIRLSRIERWAYSQIQLFSENVWRIKLQCFMYELFLLFINQWLCFVAPKFDRNKLQHVNYHQLESKENNLVPVLQKAYFKLSWIPKANALNWKGQRDKYNSNHFSNTISGLCVCTKITLCHLCIAITCFAASKHKTNSHVRYWISKL